MNHGIDLSPKSNSFGYWVKGKDGFNSFIVKNASWFDVFKWLVTRGKKGKLYTIIRNPQPKHFNCRCSVVDEVEL